MPIRVDYGDGPIVERFPIFPVHEIFAMVAQSPETFGKSCLLRQETTSLGEFWEHVRPQDWFQRHPVADPDCQHLLPYTVPIALFGDDCRIYKEEKITVWQCSFVLSTETAVLSRFVLAVLPDWAKVPDYSYRDVEAALVWSFQAALDGKWPTHDHKGLPLDPVHGETRHSMAGKPLCSFEPRHRAAFVGVKAPDINWASLRTGL